MEPGFYIARIVRERVVHQEFLEGGVISKIKIDLTPWGVYDADTIAQVNGPDVTTTYMGPFPERGDALAELSKYQSIGVLI